MVSTVKLRRVHQTVYQIACLVMTWLYLSALDIVSMGHCFMERVQVIVSLLQFTFFPLNNTFVHPTLPPSLNQQFFSYALQTLKVSHTYMAFLKNLYANLTKTACAKQTAAKCTAGRTPILLTLRVASRKTVPSKAKKPHCFCPSMYYSSILLQH